MSVGGGGVGRVGTFRHGSTTVTSPATTVKHPFRRAWHGKKTEGQKKRGLRVTFGVSRKGLLGLGTALALIKTKIDRGEQDPRNLEGTGGGSHQKAVMCLW